MSMYLHRFPVLTSAPIGPETSTLSGTHLLLRISILAGHSDRYFSCWVRRQFFLSVHFVFAVIEYIGRFEAVNRYLCISSLQSDYVHFVCTQNNWEWTFVRVLYRDFDVVTCTNTWDAVLRSSKTKNGFLISVAWFLCLYRTVLFITDVIYHSFQLMQNKWKHELPHTVLKYRLTPNIPYIESRSRPGPHSQVNRIRFIENIKIYWEKYESHKPSIQCFRCIKLQLLLRIVPRKLHEFIANTVKGPRFPRRVCLTYLHKNWRKFATIRCFGLPISRSALELSLIDSWIDWVQFSSFHQLSKFQKNIVSESNEVSNQTPSNKIEQDFSFTIASFSEQVCKRFKQNSKWISQPPLKKNTYHQKTPQTKKAQ